MTKSCENAFAIVDLIRNDEASGTCGVDAFSLALIRSERQIRRVFTNLVFQASAFERKDVNELKDTLAKRKRLYFRHFKVAFEQLIGIPISALVVDFDRLSDRMEEAAKYRNKLFHGQLTGDSLTTSRLLSLEDDVRAWCLSLSDSSNERFGYDGFAGSTSFVKNGKPEISKIVDQRISSIGAYGAFLKELEGKAQRKTADRADQSSL
ncbi:hypothetical protein LJR255_002879 [Pararhizobium sp. LjRoot255]|uniref:hypothetical protein n=1 Tax=Pararhizobium sp. LjRoot255 TaxID=3342298 RepID=UPI003ED02072